MEACVTWQKGERLFSTLSGADGDANSSPFPAATAVRPGAPTP